MSENLNAIINARLQGREGLFRLTITDGKFSSITAQDATESVAENQLDAGGNLVAPPFVEPHIHLDAGSHAGTRVVPCLKGSSVGLNAKPA